ncbi:MAG: beta-galactosidase [Streptosporangiaceae bacterium]
MPLLFGASYYYEYQPYDRLSEDVRMMREAGVNCVRIGDAIWARCEPSEGSFDLDWVGRVLDALNDGGIAVILCTPTFAIPPWLCRRHPDVMFAAGAERAEYGARQNMDITNPTYRCYAERVTRRILERYARHPAVIGFQVDNETGSRLPLNPAVFAAFVDHLRARFGSVQRLNEVWGLNYWSHRLGDWADLWPPLAVRQMPAGGPKSGNTNPGYDLEWRRFHLGVTTDFLTWLAGIVREYARDDQFVTHDIVGGHGRMDADRQGIAQAMDISAENLQHASQDALAYPPVGRTVIDHGVAQGTGPAGLYLRADMGRGGKQANFLVTEFNARGPGTAANNFPHYDGQWRLTAYACVARGADAIMYWHWHTLHYGHETHAQGVLGHDLGPNRAYREISRLGGELAEHGDLLTGLRPDADVAFLYSQDSRMALRFHPCLKRRGGAERDFQSYERVFDTFYRAFFDARAQAAVVHPGQDFEHFPVVVVPALYISDDGLLDRLVRYAEAGGHLVLSFRCGYADEYSRARWQRAPGPLRAAVGAGYNMYSNLAGPLPLRPGEGGLSLPAEAGAEAWADELELEGATPLAYYDHPHFGRFPAVVSQAYGAGRVTYCGTLLDPAAGRALAGWVLDRTGLTPAGTYLPEPVRLTTARSRGGDRLWFLSNWSFDAQAVRPPVAGTELFSGTRFDPGVERQTELTLGPWGVAVVVESGSADARR